MGWGDDLPFTVQTACVVRALQTHGYQVHVLKKGFDLFKDLTSLQFMTPSTSICMFYVNAEDLREVVVVQCKNGELFFVPTSEDSSIGEGLVTPDTLFPFTFGTPSAFAFVLKPPPAKYRQERKDMKMQRAQAARAEAMIQEEAVERERQTRVADERDRRLEIHDAMMASEKVVAEAKLANRKQAAALARAAKANQPPLPSTPFTRPPSSKKAARPASITHGQVSDEIQHNVFVLPTQRKLRSDRFVEKQNMAHSAKVACKNDEKLERHRNLAATRSAHHEAAIHVVPALPSINDVISEKLNAIETA
jgi:hypothetical protein